MAGFGLALSSVITDGWSTDRAADQVVAEDVLLRAVQLSPDCAEAHCALGMLRRTQGRPDEAVALLHTAVTLDRYHPRYVDQLGMALMFSGQPQRALARIKAALRLGPHEANLGSKYWGLGACQLLLGHAHEAITYFHTARALNPTLSYIHLWLASAYGLEKRSLQAEQALQEAMRLRAEYASVASFVNMPVHTFPDYIPFRDRILVKGLRQAGLPAS